MLSRHSATVSEPTAVQVGAIIFLHYTGCLGLIRTPGLIRPGCNIGVNDVAPAICDYHYLQGAVDTHSRLAC